MENVEQLDLFSRLETLPMQAICDAVKGRDADTGEGEVETKTKEELIEVLIRCGIDNEQVQKLLDRYAYGKSVTFSLWHLDGEFSKDSLQRLEKRCSHTIEISNSHYRKLTICNVSDRGDRIEIVYKYSKKHGYLDESGVEKLVWERQIGCCWVGKIQPYIAVIGKDEKVWSRMANVIAAIIERKNTLIRPPQKAIDRCFETALQSKVTLVGADGDRVTIARAEGFTEEQAAEAKRHEQSKKRVSGGFKTQIGTCENVSARFNTTRGNITIQKFLPVEDLFAWTENAISIIFEEIENLKSQPAKDIFKAIGKEIIWSGVRPEYFGALEWILTQLIRHGNACENIEIVLPEEYKAILTEEKNFISVYRAHCIQCDAPVPATCRSCGSVLSVYQVKNRSCPQCGNFADNPEHAIVCMDNHNLPFYDVKHCWFFPTSALIGKIEMNLKKVLPGVSVGQRWYIANMQLVIHPEKDQAKEISFAEFDDFISEEVALTDARKEWATLLKEKCGGGCSNKKCAECSVNPQEVCLVRIFQSAIRGFRPQPHRGGEYGDVSGQLLLKKQPLEMKGIMKSNTKNRKGTSKEERINSPLLSSSSAGQEIIRQVVEQGLVDSRCDVIAIIVPQYIDAGFKGTLRFLCKLGNKRVTFWELDQICRIIESFKNDCRGNVVADGIP